METPEQLFSEIMKLLGKKRSDLLESREFETRINHCLKNHEKYSLDIPSSKIEELYIQMSKVKFNGLVWEFIIQINKNPLPNEIGVLLPKQIGDRGYDMLANSYQNLEVLYAAADYSKYARSRLCIRLFINPTYSIDELHRFINLYGKDSVLRILKNKTPNPISKYDAFNQEEIEQLTEKWDDSLSSKQKSKKRKHLKRPIYRDERMEEEKRINKNNQ